MLPNLNLKKMQRMMKQLGMNMEELNADEVLIFLSDGNEIHVRNPQVVKMKIQGKETFQISGDVQEGGISIEIDDKDINLVIQQTGVSEEDAKKALEEAAGDIAKAILALKKED